jgi:hypothetical protein
MFHNNLPNGYVGSALVDSSLPVVATTANVDYQVDGDGTAIWNLSNPCGFFRQAGECVYESPLEPLPANATLTKEVVYDDPFDGTDELVGLSGVTVAYDGVDENEFPVSGSAFTNNDGTVTFAVPGGVYDITLSGLDAPEGYEFVGELEDLDVVVEAGGAVTVTNEVELVVSEGTGTLTKIIEGLPLDYVSLESQVYFCPAVDDPEADGAFAACVDSAVVTGGYGEEGEADNTVSAEVAAGAYTICTAVTVEVTDGEFVTSGGCENTYDATPEDDVDDVDPIVVVDGGTTTVINDFEDTTVGTLDVNVRSDADAPIEGAEVCVYPFGDLTMEPICGTTDVNGDVEFGGIPAGAHTVSVSADGFEQESSVTTGYTPSGDAADGGDDDSGVDADVIVALDPAVAP